jgi:hypothetical protein
MSAEAYQEGVTPVQAFTSRAIPASAGVPLEQRRGRPPRAPAEVREDADGHGIPPTEPPQTTN